MVPEQTQNDAPLVAVFMLAYNHEKYVAQAIESVLMQQTNFRFVYFIGEDCSKDNTRAICQEYERKYPDILRVICTKENSLRQNSENIWKATHESGAKYLALIEGDDYWTDPNKLQKQVDFLEANPDFSFTFTAIDVVDETGGKQLNKKHTHKFEKDVLTIDDFILAYVSLAHWATIVMRNIMPHPMPEFYYRAFSGDVFTTIVLADKGKVKYFPEVSAIYRNHAGGWTKTKNTLTKSNDKLMELYRNLDEYFGFKYHKLFKQRFLANAKVQLIFGAKDLKGLARLKHYFKIFPDYLKYSDKVNLKEIIYYHVVLFAPLLLRFFKKPVEE